LRILSNFATSFQYVYQYIQGFFLCPILIIMQAGSSTHLRRSWGNPEGIRKELRDKIEGILRAGSGADLDVLVTGGEASNLSTSA
jgi:hypothetical protein